MWTEPIILSLSASRDLLSFIFVCPMNHSNPYIKLGASFDFFYLGLFLIFLVITISLIVHPSFFSLLIPAFYVMRSAKGVEFDITKMQFRLYYSFIGFRIGSWLSYMPNDELWLHKSSYFERVTFRTARFSKEATRTYYFDVYLIRQNDDNVELGSFNSYLEAHAFLVKWSEILGLQKVDHYGSELLESLQRNQSGRRRR